jgi:hypothetical protein
MSGPARNTAQKLKIQLNNSQWVGAVRVQAPWRKSLFSGTGDIPEAFDYGREAVIWLPCGVSGGLAPGCPPADCHDTPGYLSR